MAVFRVEKTRDYTTMSNHHLRNKALSVKAKGLMSLMLSLPEDWDYTLAGLAKLNRDGVDSIRNAVQELEKAGYIHREFARNESGTFDGNIYTIYETPVHVQEDPQPLLENPTTDVEDPPLLDSPATDNPLPEKPLLENPTQLNTNRLNTKIPPISPKGGHGPNSSDKLFQAFWRAYPRKVNKTKAAAAWKRLKPDLALCRKMAEALDRFSRSEQWTRGNGVYIPHPSTWLNNRRWEDEDLPPIPEDMPCRVTGDEGVPVW